MQIGFQLDVCGCRQQLRAQHGAPGMQPPPQQGMFPQQQSGAAMYTGMQQGSADKSRTSNAIIRRPCKLNVVLLKCIDIVVRNKGYQTVWFGSES
jgi:hypothetical protein